MQQTEIDTAQPDTTADDTDAVAGETDAAPALPTPAAMQRPWPADLPAQMRAVADLLTASPAPLSEARLADRFTGRGPWKKRLPQVLQTLEALGRTRAVPVAGGQPLWRGA